MPTASFNKFHAFVEAMAEKKHNLGADTLTVFLTNTAPNATDAVLADITQISYTNLSPRVLTVVSSAQTSGVYKLVLAPLTLTASGGAVESFRYVGVYNDTAANDELVGWYDHGTSVALADGGVFVVNFSTDDGVLTLT